MTHLDRHPGRDGAPDDYDPEVARIIRRSLEAVPTDVERLVAASLRIGTRMRRRRRLAVSALSVAGVATVVSATLWTTGLNLTDAPITPAPASSPTASDTASDRASGAEEGSLCPSGDGGRAAAGDASAPVTRDQRRAARPATVPPAEDECAVPESPAPQELPVRIGRDGTRAGWACEPPADEKFICTRGDDSVVLNLRDASAHQAYTSDPTKQASSATYVGPVHGDHFVTLEPVTGTPDLADLASYLVWEDAS